MNLNISTNNVNTICEGCLSTDRKLSVIFDISIRQVFSSFIGELDYINNPLALCWECTAIIKKIIRYKAQVQNAHRQLVTHMLHQSNFLQSLSTLTTSHRNNRDIHIIYCDKLNNSEKSPLRSKRIIKNKTEEKDSYIFENLEEIPKSDQEIASEKEREPVFIKVENDIESLEQELDYGGFDDFYADEKQNSPKVDIGKSKSGKRKKRKSETVADFNDSDDEPLNKLKRNHKVQSKKEQTDTEYGATKLTTGVVKSRHTARTLQKLGLQPGFMEAIRLSWQEVEEERQKALASDSYLRHEHRCSDCAVGFNHKSKLDNHMRKHHPSTGTLECSVCHIRCGTQASYTAHRSRHRIRWRCTICGELGSRASVVADHCVRAHAAAAPRHACRLCPHVATTLSKLRNHLKNHGERQKCHLCDKTFRDKSTLKTHLFIHKGEKEYACPTCGKMFLFKKAMQLHAATHEAPALLYCHECDMNFKNQMSYYQHMKYNLKHVDPARLKYECGECGKKFMKASRLSDHNTAVHLKLTPVSCPQPGCGFACASRPALRAHIGSVHRNKRADRNYVCHACGKAYTNKKTLEGHLRSHSGERPFSCVRCSAAFGYSAALYNHTRLVHLKHKPPRRPAVNTAWQNAPPTMEHNTELT